MLIRDRLSSQLKDPPATLTEERMVAEAVAIMAERNYGAIVVVDNEQRVVGILTERDVLKRIVNVGVDATKTPIAEVMTRDPSLAREHDEIEEWMQTMSQKRFRRIPVVDENNKIMAILTQTDLTAYAWPILLARTRELAQQESQRRFYTLMIGGALLIYAIAMVFVVAAFI